MNTVEQAKAVRAKLLAADPTKRARCLRKVGRDIDVENMPAARATMDFVRGLGPKGIRELLVATGLWLIENDITQHPLD